MISRRPAQAGRLDVVDWGPAPGVPDFWRRVLTEPNIVWLAVLNGLVGSMAAFGTDYDLMQRLLTVETRGESQRTLSLTPIGTLVTLLIYLGLGAGLFTYYAQHPAPTLPRPDEIFPHFVRTAMPEPAARPDAEPPSCSPPSTRRWARWPPRSSTDIYRPLLVRNRRERHYLRVSRAARCSPSGWSWALLAWGFSFFEPDPLARLQDRRGDLRLAARGLPARAAVPRPVSDTRQRGGDGRHGGGEPRAAPAVRVRRAALRWSWLVIVGTVGTIALSVLLTALSPRR